MSHDLTPQADRHPAPEVAEPATFAVAAATDVSPAPVAPRRRSSWRRTGLLFGGLFLALGGLFAGLLLGHHSGQDDEEAPAVEGRVVSVATVRPQRKTVVRRLEQPGTIQAFAQVEIYAKASGYLKRIQRAWTGRHAAQWVTQQLGAAALPRGGAAMARLTHLALASAVALQSSPQVDIGSTVRADEVLLEIDAPELRQDVLQKESLWLQAVAEMEQARSSITAAEAAIVAGAAQLKQAEADIRRAASEREFRVRELERIKALVRDKVITGELADEKINQVNAAIAALEGTQAKVQAVQAEQSVLSSKLAMARADLRVKEARVRVARDDWDRARILANYAIVRAPFDGVITRRDVDEGDLVQNSATGQTRRLMVVADVEQVKIVLQVPDKDCPWIRVGAPATVALPGEHRVVATRVARSSESLDPQTRTMQVEIDLDNRERFLRPGDYVDVQIDLQRLDNALVTPVSAVYTRKSESFVLLANGGVVRRQPVRIRFDDGREMVVVKLIDGKELPLLGTEELIVNNKGDLRDGQKVKTSHRTAQQSAHVPPLAWKAGQHEQDFEGRVAFARLGGLPRSVDRRLRPFAAVGRGAAGAADRLPTLAGG